MAHDQEFDLQKHLRTVAAGLFVVGFLMSGMTAFMAVLVYDGLYDATTEGNALGGNDYSTYFSHAGPVLLIVFLAMELFFLWLYFKYAKRVRQNPENRFEF